MVRDPSDGSMREKPALVSGLAPAPTKEQQEELKRLDASREWLKEYKAQKASRGIT